MNWLVADWDDNKEHVFKGVLAGLDCLGYRTQTISRSDMGRRAELVAAIRSGSFDVLLTWQRFYPMQKDVLAAIAESGIQTVFMDFGFVPHYGCVVFDTTGENATSSWLDMWATSGPVDLSQDDLDAAELLMRSEADRARVLSMPNEPGLDRLRMPFVFVPLQRPGDAVVKFDSSVHEFGKLLRRVLLLARGAQFVVAKPHPLDHDLDFGTPDRVDSSHLIIRRSFGGNNEAVCDYLLSRASLVVGVNSNMLFRAMLFGTPVVATGRGWYSGSGAFHEVPGLEGLNSLSAPLPNLEAQRRYVATCLTRQLLFEDLDEPEKLSDVLRRIGIKTKVGRAAV